MKKGLMRLAVCCTCAVLAAAMAGCSVKSSNISTGADSEQSAYSSVSQSTGEESLPVESTAEESTTESPSDTSEESTGTDSTVDSQSDFSSGDSQSDDSSVTDSTTADSQSTESSTGDSQSADSSTDDSQSADSSTGDSQSDDSSVTDSTTADSQSSDSSTSDSQSTESSTGDSQSTESSTGNSQSTDSSTGDSQDKEGGETGGEDSGKTDDTPDNISVLINISDIGVATALEDGHELGTGVYIYSSGSDLAVASGKKAYNGTTFTYCLKTGADVTSAAIKIVATDACTVTLYAMSASEDEDREVGLFSTEFDPVGATQTIAGGTKIVELNFSIPAAGTYYLGSVSKGINIYYIAVTY